jgi:hypothetical protein
MVWNCDVEGLIVPVATVVLSGMLAFFTGRAAARAQTRSQQRLD